MMYANSVAIFKIDNGRNLDLSISTAIIQATAITLRAFHFAKHGKEEEGYTSITADICKEFITNDTVCWDKKIGEDVAKNPFEYTKESRIDMICEYMLTKFSIYSESYYQPYSRYMPFSKTEPNISYVKADYYYLDSLCYDYWQTLLDSYDVKDPENISEAFALIVGLSVPSEADCEYINAKERCRSCHYYDVCTTKNKPVGCTRFRQKLNEIKL